MRENGRRRVVVLANTDGRTDTAAIVARYPSGAREAKLPEGFFTALEGTFQAQEAGEPHHRHSVAVLAQPDLCHSLQPLPVRGAGADLMGSVPLALIGSVAALWLAGQPLSVASMIGFITLDRHRRAQRHSQDQPLHQSRPAREHAVRTRLVVRGSLERMTPVLMTALSAGVALVPLLIDAATPGKEILHPVAVTIFGGLISATLLDAFLTPILFLRFGRKPLERLRALQGGAEHNTGLSPTQAY